LVRDRASSVDPNWLHYKHKAKAYVFYHVVQKTQATPVVSGSHAWQLILAKSSPG